MTSPKEAPRASAIQRVCGACAAVAPPVGTDFTLIGPPHSWRVIRVPLTEGANTLEWRCSACWSRRAESS